MSAFAIEGELTIYRAAGLKDELLAAVSAGPDLELDLSRTSEIDSAGLQLLLLAGREASAAGRRFTISARSTPVSEALELCGLGGFAA